MSQKEKITDYILKTKDGDKKLLDTLFNKGLLCKQLELYMLDKDRQKGRRWYYGVEEAIEQKLNKK